MPTTKPSKPAKAEKDKSRYIEAVGRRKSAVARVRIFPSTTKALKEIQTETATVIDAKKLDFAVNGRPVGNFFPTDRLVQSAIKPFAVLNVFFKTTARVQGGGPTAQAESIRLGLARALNKLNEKWHIRLKKTGLLTRDPRMVERKHPGLRKARRPQQWRKR